MAEELYRYRAFISYRHVARDRKWARWLIEKLETYRTPRALVRRGASSRIGQIFRDDDEIPASSDLSHQIENALPPASSSLWFARPIRQNQNGYRRK